MEEFGVGYCIQCKYRLVHPSLPTVESHIRKFSLRCYPSSDPIHFPDLLRITTTSTSIAPTTWQSKLRLLKRIYHLLLSVPIPTNTTSILPLTSSRTTRSTTNSTSNSPLSKLPTPDLLVLSRHSSVPVSLRSSTTVTSLQRLEEEILKMSTIILGVLVVWGEGNEGVVRVIGGLEESVQRGLKGAIEEVTWEVIFSLI